MKRCIHCGTYIDNNARQCPNCGGNPDAPTPPPYNSYSNPGQQSHNYNYGYGNGNRGGYNTPYSSNNAFEPCGPEGKIRGVAALLAIFLGGLGVQYFYLNKVGAGFLSILLAFVTGGIWQIVTIIQGVLMLCMSNDSFREKYVETRSSFPLF